MVTTCRCDMNKAWTGGLIVGPKEPVTRDRGVLHTTQTGWGRQKGEMEGWVRKLPQITALKYC